MTGRSIGALIALFVIGVAACGGSESGPSGPLVGEPLLPDLVPDPPAEVRISLQQDGKTLLLFTSTLANVGEGDLIVTGQMTDSGWQVQQEVSYSESGFEISPVPARLVWAGDQHSHWHVSRAAIYWLEEIGPNGEPVADSEQRFDSKVGFCFYDSHQVLDTGPSEIVYEESGCAHEGDTEFRMGMSVGWSDVYPFFMPGQEIDITDLPDGMYRLWVEADRERWFRESNTDNNTTWVDIELSTRESEGVRLALVVDVGPEPGESQ